MNRRQFISFLIIILVGLLIWFSPHSENIHNKGWHLFAIFMATILGIIFKPLPMSVFAILSMTILDLTHTLTLEETLAGFHNPIAWLVLFAFFISQGFIKTGLGSRISYYFVSILGRKTLGLSYGLLMSELILAPAIPSVTARTGGVIFPVVQGLAKSFASDPQFGTERRIGSFLMTVAYQGSVITSAMFLTAMAANPFLVELTQQFGYYLSWSQWALAASIPGLINLAIMPFMVFKLYPPIIRKTPNAADFARLKIQEMGKMQKQEWIMLAIFILLIILWISGNMIKMNATIAAMVGLSCLLIFNVLKWEDIVKNYSAWDTYIWFSSLIMIATQLNHLGFTPWLSEQVVQLVGQMNWMPAFTILGLVYFYSHYFFASNTAHVGAMYPAFLMIAISLGTPSMIAILVFAFLSNLMGGLTHYGSGPAPIYYGSNYIELKAWWRIGFLLSLINLSIWIGLGSIWWKLIGIW
ncbi:MAG: anion permease [Chlamydiales bacterium]